jgi:hypothetical protein
MKERMQPLVLKKRQLVEVIARTKQIAPRERKAARLLVVARNNSLGTV